MTQVKIGDTVQLRYSIMTEDARVVASSGDEVTQLRLGRDTAVPGLADAVLGMSPDTVRIKKIPSHQAFGERHPELVTELEHDFFLAQGVAPEVGMELDVRQPDGEVVKAMVSRVSEDLVTLDANHPLAGKDLILVVELSEIVD